MEEGGVQTICLSFPLQVRVVVRGWGSMMGWGRVSAAGLLKSQFVLVQVGLEPSLHPQHLFQEKTAAGEGWRARVRGAFPGKN